MDLLGDATGIATLEVGQHHARLPGRPGAGWARSRPLSTPETLRTQARTSSRLAEEREHALRQQRGRLVVVLGEIVLGAGIDEQLRSGHGCGEPLRDLEVLVALEDVQLRLTITVGWTWLAALALHLLRRIP